MQFGNYDMVQLIAAGSTATVYKARHRELGQFAAIKELNPELRESPRAFRRFSGPKRTFSRDSTIRTLSPFMTSSRNPAGRGSPRSGSTAYIETLLAGAGAMTAEQCLGVLRGALQGLAYAHQRGVVHGDIAPGNIIADRAGTSKLVDFGVSAQVG